MNQTHWEELLPDIGDSEGQETRLVMDRKVSYGGCRVDVQWLILEVKSGCSYEPGVKEQLFDCTIRG
jgi:hypothetical protein